MLEFRALSRAEPHDLQVGSTPHELNEVKMGSGIFGDDILLFWSRMGSCKEDKHSIQSTAWNIDKAR